METAPRQDPTASTMPAHVRENLTLFQNLRFIPCKILQTLGSHSSDVSNFVASCDAVNVENHMSIVWCERDKDWKPLFENASVRFHGFERCCNMVRSDSQCGNWFFGAADGMATCFCLLKGQYHPQY